MGSWQVSAAEDSLEVGSHSSGQIIVRFDADGQLTTETQMSGAKQGTWSYVPPADGNDAPASTFPFELEIQGELMNEPYQIQIRVLDENSLEMVPPNLHAIENRIEDMPFHRVTTR